MKAEKIDVNYELTAKDYIDFNLYHMKHSDKIKRLMFLQRFIIPLIYFILPFVLAKSTNVPLWLWMAASAAVYILWVYIFPKRMEKNISRKLSKALSQERNAKLLGKHSLAVTEEGISDIGTGGETNVKWNSIRNFIDSEEHFFIFISDTKAFIIPKRAFNTNEAIDIFSDAISKKVSA